eukprot:7200282-Pyramimonas_sp.AAC.1
MPCVPRLQPRSQRSRIGFAKHHYPTASDEVREGPRNVRHAGQAAACGQRRAEDLSLIHI